MGDVIEALEERQIVHSDIFEKGTQMKLILRLKGNQRVIFKPKRPRDTWNQYGELYSGTDRPEAEVVAFHFSLLLNLTTVPITVGRRLSLIKDILPSASNNLAKTIFIKGKNSCVYGVCPTCGVSRPVCGTGDKISGVLILWLPDAIKDSNLPHPWARSYVPGKLAEWEKDPNFCTNKFGAPIDRVNATKIAAFVDAAILDFFIQNGDRHHYNTVSLRDESPIIMMDNGKGLKDAFVDHLDILAPLFQCCRIRKSTYDHLNMFSGSSVSVMISRLLQTDDLAASIPTDHLSAFERRFYFIMAAIEACKARDGQSIFV